MAKSSTSIRIDDNIKKQAMEMFEKLGIDLSAAINMFLVQSILTGGLPFPVTLPSVPRRINVDAMTSNELQEKLQRGYNDVDLGNTKPASEVFNQFRERHK